MPDLFDLGDLPSWLQVPEVDAATATRVRRSANGWLMSATRLSTWPDPIPDDLWAWAIELAAIAYRNPSGASRTQIDDYSEQYDPQADAARRKEILAAARSAYGTNSGPLYSFPVPDWSWTSTTTVYSSD